MLGLSSLTDILRAETDPEVLRLLVVSLHSVFEALGEGWTEIVNLAREFIVSPSPIRVRAGLEILAGLVPRCTDTFVAGATADLSSIAESALATPELSVFAFELFAALTAQSTPPVVSLIEPFAAMLISASPDVPRACECFRQCLRASPPSSDVIHGLLELAASDSIPIDQRHMALFLIKTAARWGLGDAAADAFRIVLAVCAAQFNPDVGFIDNDDSRIAIAVFKRLASPEAARGLLVDDAEAAESFGALCGLIGIAEGSPGLFTPIADAAVLFGLSRIELGCPAVTVASLSLFRVLVAAYGDSLHDFAEVFLRLSLELAGGDDEEVRDAALDFFGAAVEAIDVDQRALLAAVPVLCAMTPAAPVLRALAAIVFALRDDAERLPDEVFPFVWEMGHRDRAARAELVASALPVLGGLCALAPGKVGEHCPEVIEFIVECGADTDRTIKSDALQNLINICRFGGDVAPLGPVLALVCAVLDGEADAEVVANAFTLFRQILKLYPRATEAFPGGVPAFSQWGTRLVDFWLRAADGELVAAAIRAGFEFFIVMSEAGALFQFFETVVEVVKTADDEGIVGTSLAVCQKFVSRKPDVASSFLPQFVEVAVGGMMRTLNCQDSRNFAWNDVLGPRIYGLLAEAIRQYESAFTMAPVFEAFSGLDEKVEDIEACTILGVFANCVRAGREVPGELVAFALSKLEICDFSVCPNPLGFLRALIGQEACEAAIVATFSLACCSSRLRSCPRKKRTGGTTGRRLPPPWQPSLRCPSVALSTRGSTSASTLASSSDRRSRNCRPKATSRRLSSSITASSRWRRIARIWSWRTWATCFGCSLRRS
jgi:hypothetical protein